jgi:hypothetical protein
MKKKGFRFIISIILTVISNVILYSQTSGPNQTVTIPHLDQEIIDGQNIVFTSSFHSAWSRLKEDILNEDVKVNRQMTLVNSLNNMEEVKIDPNSSVSLGGFIGEGIIEKINSSLKSKFNRTVNFSNYKNDPFNIICYSYFNKEIKFEIPFETFNDPFPFFGSGQPVDVNCFGIWTCGRSELHQKIKRQVTVIDFKNRRDFILSLKNPSGNDEVIIALISPSKTLSTTIIDVVERIKNSEPTKLVSNDRLVIPKLNLNISKDYTELLGVKLANTGYEDYFFAEAKHDIGFSLNESGASANSEAKIILKKGPGPRTMIVNRPFLIMMREKNSENPYFAAWIGNHELLVAAE